MVLSIICLMNLSAQVPALYDSLKGYGQSRTRFILGALPFQLYNGPKLWESEYLEYFCIDA